MPCCVKRATGASTPEGKPKSRSVFSRRRRRHLHESSWGGTSLPWGSRTSTGWSWWARAAPLPSRDMYTWCGADPGNNLATRTSVWGGACRIISTGYQPISTIQTIFYIFNFYFSLFENGDLSPAQEVQRWYWTWRFGWEWKEPNCHPSQETCVSGSSGEKKINQKINEHHNGSTILTLSHSGEALTTSEENLNQVIDTCLEHLRIWLTLRPRPCYWSHICLHLQDVVVITAAQTLGSPRWPASCSLTDGCHWASCTLKPECCSWKTSLGDGEETHTSENVN